MFFGMLLVDAALAAWAVGILGQPNAPKWVRVVIVWIGVTLIVSVAGVVAFSEKSENAVAGQAGRIAPFGAAVAGIALLTATIQQRRKKP